MVPEISQIGGDAAFLHDSPGFFATTYKPPAQNPNSFCKPKDRSKLLASGNLLQFAIEAMAMFEIVDQWSYPAW